MILARPLISIALSYFVVVNLQAQVGKKYFGRASYYDGKFNSLHNSNSEIDDPAKYFAAHFAAHRDLDLNSIIGVLNTPNNRKDFIKIYNRGHLSSNGMVDLSLTTVKDLELLPLCTEENETQIFSVDKPEYSIYRFHKGLKGKFNLEFYQNEPILIGAENIINETLMANYLTMNPSSKLDLDSFLDEDSLKNKQSKSEILGFRQHKYIKVSKDSEGRYYLDSSNFAQPTVQGVFSVSPQTSHLNTKESHAQITKPQLPPQILKSKITKMATVIQPRMATLPPEKENRIVSFPQHNYVRIYTDSDGRIRMDTTQKAPVQLTKNNTNQTEKWDEKSKNINPALSISSKLASSLNPLKAEVTKPKEMHKDGFRQHSYIKIYQDKDGRIKFDTTSFERPN